MPRPWSFKSLPYHDISSQWWNGQNGLWNSHKCILECRKSLSFISVHCYEQLPQTVYQHCRQSRVSDMMLTSVTQVPLIENVLRNHVECTNFTNIKTFPVRASVIVNVCVCVCVWCVMCVSLSLSLSDFGQCVGESQPARWRAPPHRSLRCPPGSRGGKLHSECLQEAPQWASAPPHLPFNAWTVIVEAEVKNDLHLQVGL